MEKQRTHLTPEEVQEFIDLGVDFGETVCKWLLFDPLDKIEGYIPTWELYLSDNVHKGTYRDPNFKILPAPSLQVEFNFDIGDKVFVVAYDEQNREFACPAEIVRVSYDKWGGKDPYEHIEYTSNDLFRGGYIESNDLTTAKSKEEIIKKIKR
ncbi:MAG: hypothetical protein SNH18_09505 [Rikenellaceae bacterium]